MHEQYYHFEPGSTPLKEISDKKMYVTYSYIPIRRRTESSLIYFDSKGRCHYLSKHEAEEYKKRNISFEECLEKKGVVLPVEFLPNVVTVSRFENGDTLSKFYKVCRESKIVKGHRMSSLNPYGAVIGKFYQPDFSFCDGNFVCTLEVSLTQSGIKNFKKYLKEINDDVLEIIQDSLMYKRINAPISEYKLKHLYLTKDGTLLFTFELFKEGASARILKDVG